MVSKKMQVESRSIHTTIVFPNLVGHILYIILCSDASKTTFLSMCCS